MSPTAAANAATGRHNQSQRGQAYANHVLLVEGVEGLVGRRGPRRRLER